MEPLDASIHLAFAFDIGYEIDLERAGPLVPGRVRGRWRGGGGRPSRSGIAPRPCGSNLDPAGLALPGVAPTGPPRAELASSTSARSR